jgi:hypothetical protein
MIFFDWHYNFLTKNHAIDSLMSLAKMFLSNQRIENYYGMLPSRQYQNGHLKPQIEVLLLMHTELSTENGGADSPNGSSQIALWNQMNITFYYRRNLPTKKHCHLMDSPPV